MEENQEKLYFKGRVHFVLSHSYVVFLFAVVLGVLTDILLPLQIFSSKICQDFGLLIILIGSFIIFWAQKASAKCKKEKGKEDLSCRFEIGPYKYLRSPTHFGLFIMTLGLAVLINSLFSIVFTFIAYLLTKFVFLKKEESILEQKYGEEYKNYKSKIKNWI